MGGRELGRQDKKRIEWREATAWVWDVGCVCVCVCNEGMTEQTGLRRQSSDVTTLLNRPPLHLGGSRKQMRPLSSFKKTPTHPTYTASISFSPGSTQPYQTMSDTLYPVPRGWRPSTKRRQRTRTRNMGNFLPLDSANPISSSAVATSTE